MRTLTPLLAIALAGSASAATLLNPGFDANTPAGANLTPDTIITSAEVGTGWRGVGAAWSTGSRDLTYQIAPATNATFTYSANTINRSGGQSDAARWFGQVVSASGGGTFALTLDYSMWNAGAGGTNQILYQVWSTTIADAAPDFAVNSNTVDDDWTSLLDGTFAGTATQYSAESGTILSSTFTIDPSATFVAVRIRTNGITAGGGTGEYVFMDNIQIVPEPTAVALGSLALLGFLRRRR